MIRTQEFGVEGCGFKHHWTHTRKLFLWTQQYMDTWLFELVTVTLCNKNNQQQILAISRPTPKIHMIRALHVSWSHVMFIMNSHVHNNMFHSRIVTTETFGFIHTIVYWNKIRDHFTYHVLIDFMQSKKIHFMVLRVRL